MPISIRRSLYEWSAIVLLLSASTLGVVIFGTVRHWSAGLLMVLVFTGIALYLARPFFNRTQKDFRFPPGSLLFGVMILYTAALIPFAAVPYEAKVELLKIASYAGAYLAWTELGSRYKRWRFLLGIPLLVGTLIALYALVLHVQESTMVLTMERHEQYGMRASGTFMAPAHFGAYMGTMICLAITMALTPAAGAFLRTLSVYGLILFFPALFLSGSRSGWVGTMLGVPVILLLMAWRKSMRLFMVALIAFPLTAGAMLGALWFSSPMFQERVESAVKVEGTAAWRLIAWQDTLEMIKDKPVFGHGPGSYRWLYPPYQSWDGFRWLRYAHNEYLHLTAEYGLAGFAVMSLLILTILGRCLVLYRNAETDKDAFLIAGFTGALMAALGHAFFDFNLHVFSLVHLLVLFGGVAMAGFFTSGALKTRKLSLRIWAVPGVVLLIASLAAVIGSLQVGLSNAMTRLAQDKKERIDPATMRLTGEAGKLYERAMRIDQSNWVPFLELGNISRREAFWIRDPQERKRKVEEAMAYYKRAIERNPFDMNAVYGMGRCWYLLGDEELSLEYLQRAVRFWPTHTFYAKQLGLQLREMGRIEEALEAFERAARIAPGDRMIQINLRTLRRKLDRKAEHSEQSRQD